jgi:hypothetical protein
MGIT